MSNPVARQLCDLIDLLKKQHKTGVTPTFGQIDDLFDLSGQLRSLLDDPRDEPWHGCSVRGCTQAAVDRVTDRRYCRTHAMEATSVLTLLQRLMPDVHAAVSRVSWPTRRAEGGVVTGPDPRD